VVAALSSRTGLGRVRNATSPAFVGDRTSASTSGRRPQWKISSRVRALGQRCCCASRCGRLTASGSGRGPAWRTPRCWSRRGAENRVPNHVPNCAILTASENGW